jgi:hypothetical protein
MRLALPTPSLLPRSGDSRLGVARCRQATAPDVEGAPIRAIERQPSMSFEKVARRLCPQPAGWFTAPMLTKAQIHLRRLLTANSSDDHQGL